MSMKTVLTVALLGFVLVALGWAMLKPGEAPVEATPVESIDSGVVAYYLHPESRCATCLKIEELAEMALRDNYPEAVEQGRLQWLALNVDQPANKHFMEDFELHTTSLVLVKKVDGETVEFKNCTRVWELVHSPMQFDRYVSDEIAAFLGDA